MTSTAQERPAVAQTAAPARSVPARRRPLRRKAAGDVPYSLLQRMRGSALVVVLLVLAVTVGSAARMFLQHAVLQPRLEQALDAAAGLAQAHAGMLDQETGVRGYLLTRDVGYLEPYYSGQDLFLQGSAIAAARTPDDPLLQAALQRTSRAAMLWTTRYAGPATVSGGLPAGTREAATIAALPGPDQGKRLFDDYRQEQAELLRLNQQHLRDLLATKHRFNDLVSGSELVLGLGLVLVLVVRTRRLRSELFAPLEEIDAVAASLAQGRLEQPVALTGAPPLELRAAAERLELLRARLVRQERQLGAERLATTRRLQLHQAVLRHSADFSADSDVGSTCRAIADAAAHLTGCSDVSLWAVDGQGVRLAAATTDRPVVERAERLLEAARRYGREEADMSAAPDLLALPLVAAGRTIAVLLLSDVPTSGDGQDRLDAVRSLAAHAATALEAARLHQEILTASLRDELTGLWNRRRFNEDLLRETGLGHRHGHPVSLLMLDLDRFKSYNDTHGHPAGDALLREIGLLLREALRDGDGAYRLGGEEFAVLLSHDDEEAAGLCGERLRGIVETRLSARGVTVSVGAATVQPSGRGAAEGEVLVRRADEALYAAKSTGRNRVVAASAAPVLPLPLQRVEAGAP